MSFADNVKKYREKKGISQAELAAMCSITQPMVAQYEKGMKIPSFIVGVQLAKSLDTTCEELAK